MLLYAHFHAHLDSPYALPIVALCSLYAHVDSPMLSLPSAYGFSMVSL